MPHPSVIAEGRLGEPVGGRSTPELSLDLVGFREAERKALEAALADMGSRLGVRFSFGGAASEVLVLEAAHALSLAPATASFSIARLSRASGAVGSMPSSAEHLISGARCR
jgi:hypothetical protein